MQLFAVLADIAVNARQYIESKNENEIVKAQAVLALLILIFEIMVPSNVVFAAESVAGTAPSGSGILIGKEYIRPPEQSIVVLKDEDLEEGLKRAEQNRQSVNQPVGTTYMMASAYNSVPWQTDGSPYHTAIGSMTRDGIVATNYFPIGTRLRFPDLFGDKEFRVEDRMNRRYSKTVDIWMEDIAEAKKFGRRYVKVEIVKYGLGRGVE